MVTNYEEKLRRLYDSAEEQLPYFKRNYYEQAFDKYCTKNQDIFDEINLELEGKDEDTVNEYAKDFSMKFVSIFKAEYDAISKKGKKGTYVTNHNTPLVIYLFPAILNYSAKWCKPLVEAIVFEWNNNFKETSIGYGTYSDIKSGFKTKLCYITTAVCESLGKNDDCLELNILRDYRDNILSNDEEGKELIEEYYDVAPTIVKRINRSENAKEEYLNLYNNFILKCINNIENKDYDMCRDTYTEMVTELKNRYAY